MVLIYLRTNKKLLIPEIMKLGVKMRDKCRKKNFLTQPVNIFYAPEYFSTLTKDIFLRCRFSRGRSTVSTSQTKGQFTNIFIQVFFQGARILQYAQISIYSFNYSNVFIQLINRKLLSKCVFVIRNYLLQYFAAAVFIASILNCRVFMHPFLTAEFLINTGVNCLKSLKKVCYYFLYKWFVRHMVF